MKNRARSEKNTTEVANQTGAGSPLFVFPQNLTNGLQWTPSEKAFAQQLFTVVRESECTRKKAKFCSLLDFAGHSFFDISHTSEPTLQKLLNTIEWTTNRNNQGTAILRFTGVRAALGTSDNNHTLSEHSSHVLGDFMQLICLLLIYLSIRKDEDK